MRYIFLSFCWQEIHWISIATTYSMCLLALMQLDKCISYFECTLWFHFVVGTINYEKRFRNSKLLFLYGVLLEFDLDWFPEDNLYSLPKFLVLISIHWISLGVFGILYVFMDGLTCPFSPHVYLSWVFVGWLNFSVRNDLGLHH